MSKKLSYFCKACRTVKTAKFITEQKNGDKPVEVEVFRDFEQDVKQSDGSTKHNTTKTRQLECGHFSPLTNIGLVDYNSENLSEYETAHIRNGIDRAMIGKIQKELEEVVLRHADEYQTLLKFSSKQRLYAKYAIQYLDQIKERHAKTLSNEEEKVKFETKFAHFRDLKPTTQKVIERERTSGERAADKQKSAMEAIKAMFAKSGYDGKKLFEKD
jgi:hypothetical protein